MEDPQPPSHQRVRLLFANNILTKSQEKDGLKRSWVLLKPQIETISDIVFYLIQSFDLHDSCPHGVILSMDGFVLPEFESTTILKDKDVISVKRKGSQLLDACKAVEDAIDYIEDEIVDKQALPSGIKLLAGEEFDKGTGGYQSETDEDENEAEKSTVLLQNAPSRDVASKKRKALSIIEGPKKKRQHQITPVAIVKKHVPQTEHIATPLKKKKKNHGNDLSQSEHIKTPHKKKKHVGSNEKNLSSPHTSEKCTKDLEPKSISGEPEKSKETTKRASGVSDRVKKATRSTLRKRKQRFYRNAAGDSANVGELGEIQHPVKDLNTESGAKIDVGANCTQESDESDAEGDLVPVMIRPGHIRFTRSGKVNGVQENQEANGLEAHSNAACEDYQAAKNVPGAKHKQVEEPYYWNGITSKRKGQKWGREKQSFSPWKETRDYDSHSSKGWNSRKEAAPSWKESSDLNGHSSGTWSAKKQLTSDLEGSNDSNRGKKQPPSNNYVDFDKLVPLIDSPEVGDVIAYRLLELSSSWCPELSSFRVGKIASFEPDSKKIILVPVPEYPLNLGKIAAADDDDFDGGLPPAASLYNEDGSLETDCTSLNDIRIVKRCDLTQPQGIAISAANGASVPSTSKIGNAAQGAIKNIASARSTSKWGAETHDAGKAVASGVGNQDPQTPAQTNGKKDPWEEISEAISAKKAQLSVEDAWNKKESSAKRSWSYRTLRGSAIGPTMAMLRAQNGGGRQ